MNSFQFCTGMNFAVLGLVYVASWHNDTCGPVKYCKIQTNYFHHKTNFYLAQRHVLQLKFNGYDAGMETEYINYLLSIFLNLEFLESLHIIFIIQILKSFMMYDILFSIKFVLKNRN